MSFPAFSAAQRQHLTQSIVLFKVYRSQFYEDFDDEYDGKEYNRNMPSSEEEEPGGLSVFEQTMLSWHSLQEWAQKAWAKHYQQSPIGSTQNVKPVAIQNASDRRQPAMDSDREVRPQTKDQPQTKDRPQTETSDIHAQRMTELAPGRLESGFETDRQTSVESACSSNMRENQAEAWDVDVEEVTVGEKRRGQAECQDGAEAGGEAAAGKQGKVEEKQEQRVKCRIKSHVQCKSLFFYSFYVLSSLAFPYKQFTILNERCSEM